MNVFDLYMAVSYGRQRISYSWMKALSMNSLKIEKSKIKAN